MAADDYLWRNCVYFDGQYRQREDMRQRLVEQGLPLDQAARMSQESSGYSRNDGVWFAEDDESSLGGHWVTINGSHVLINADDEVIAGLGYGDGYSLSKANDESDKRSKDDEKNVKVVGEYKLSDRFKELDKAIKYPKRSTINQIFGKKDAKPA